MMAAVEALQSIAAPPPSLCCWRAVGSTKQQPGQLLPPPPLSDRLRPPRILHSPRPPYQKYPSPAASRKAATRSHPPSRTPSHSRGYPHPLLRNPAAATTNSPRPLSPITTACSSSSSSSSSSSIQQHGHGCASYIPLRRAPGLGDLTLQRGVIRPQLVAQPQARRRTAQPAQVQSNPIQPATPTAT